MLFYIKLNKCPKSVHRPSVVDTTHVIGGFSGDKVVSFNVDGVECRAGGGPAITHATNLPRGTPTHPPTFSSLH